MVDVNVDPNNPESAPGWVKQGLKRVRDALMLKWLGEYVKRWNEKNAVKPETEEPAKDEP